MNYKNRKIIILPSNRTFEVKKGYYISPYSWSSVYWKKPEPTGLLMKFAKDHMVIDEYKKTMTKKFNDDHQFYSDRLFLVRGKDKIKRLVNEDRLSSIAKRYGYELFDPETHTIHEQYNAFKYAKVIISDEGAALANLLWCANAPKVYIIIEKGKEDYQFSTMAHEAGVNCIYVEAESLGNRMHRLDEDLFNRIIKEI